MRISGPARLVWAAGLLVLGGCRVPGPSVRPPEAAPKPSRVWFVDAGAQAGLSYSWPKRPRPLTIRDSFGYGCGFIDFDRDRRPDILLVGSPRCAVYRNRGDGTFQDVTAASGLATVEGPWIGCAAGDFDGDGWDDLLLTGYHAHRLLRNHRGRKWIDATDRLGPAAPGWESSAGFADLDQDGDLDLYIGQYVQFGPGSKQYCELTPGIRSGCPPSEYPAQRGRLLRNDGGRFTDVSGAAGITAAYGKNLALSFCDFDRDGRLDLYVANDGTPANLFRNLGSLKFASVGLQRGCALSPEGRAQAAMGVAWGDYDRDGWQDLIVTTFSGESYSLYHNEHGAFDPASRLTGLAGPTLPTLGFGVQWVDFDNDGWRDVVFANGHVYDNTNQIEAGTTFAQRPMLFLNGQGRAFIDAGSGAGPAFQQPRVGRGLATADYDGDGRVDILMVDLEGDPVLIHNQSPARGHWLAVRPLDGHGAAAPAGTRVTVSTASSRQEIELSAASSYLSASDPVAHFGLGDEDKVERVEIRWPDGRNEMVRNPPVNGELSIKRQNL